MGEQQGPGTLHNGAERYLIRTRYCLQARCVLASPDAWSAQMLRRSRLAEPSARPQNR